MPSDVERFEESPGKIAGLVQQLPSAAVDLVRRRRGVVMASIAALGAFGLLWYFSKRD
ncbi:MAG TPA: hypothetical protein VMU04_08535 [Candidatus Acidoferrum sp.]|nr:hypothetical protein [Candidatus Acidoferrum sp.]